MLAILGVVLSAAMGGHTYVADVKQYNMPEHWEVNLTGDCEDYALWIRYELKKRGIESDLVLALTEEGVRHLIIHVDGWILDNRHGRVMRQEDLTKIGYKWISMSGPDSKWYKIEQ